MLIDSHIHVGQFEYLYESPDCLMQFLSRVGVSYFAVSSTTICEGNYEKVFAELTELQQLCGHRIIPVLWILPQMLEDGGLNRFMDSGIRWRCIKIHPQLHPRAWLPGSDALKQVVSIASILQIPLLVHTGEMEGCYPSLYEDAFATYPNVTFILAHGRPIDETIEMMVKHLNCWVDTAFMPIEHVRKLCDEHLSDRVLWGTDYPIPKYYYPDIDTIGYYHDLVKQLRRTVNQDDFNKITCRNFERLFLESFNCSSTSQIPSICSQ